MEAEYNGRVIPRDQSQVVKALRKQLDIALAQKGDLEREKAALTEELEATKDKLKALRKLYTQKKEKAE